MSWRHGVLRVLDDSCPRDRERSLRRGPPSGTYTARCRRCTRTRLRARIIIIVCPRRHARPSTGFDIYIDPSGVVVDTGGEPIAGATVTLLRADAEEVTVRRRRRQRHHVARRTAPTRCDPDARRHFGWDVLTGWYKVRTTASGCTGETTPAMEVPPERIDLLISLECAEIPAPDGPSSVARTLRCAQGGQHHLGTRRDLAGPLEVGGCRAPARRHPAEHLAPHRHRGRRRSDVQCPVDWSTSGVPHGERQGARRSPSHRSSPRVRRRRSARPQPLSRWSRPRGPPRRSRAS